MMKDGKKYIPEVPRTAMEVHNMLPDGSLCEVIDNILYMSPAPTPYHQKIIGKIYAALYQAVSNSATGELYLSPVDVYLDEENVIQPNILFISGERLEIIREDGIYGVPDLIIEILSSNKKHDTERKFLLYEQFGVREYFIVEPKTKEVFHYTLDDGKYAAKTARPAELESEVLSQKFVF